MSKKYYTCSEAGDCSDLCKFVKSKNGYDIMIGSWSCIECKHLIDSNEESEYIECELYNKEEQKKEIDEVVYLSGKMTGVKYFNFPLFNDMEFRLKQKYENYEIINPATLTLELIKSEFPDYIIDVENYEEIEKMINEHSDIFTKELFLAYDLYNLLSCTKVFFMSDWRNSSGAKLEYEYAKLHGIKCYELNEKNLKLKEI